MKENSIEEDIKSINKGLYELEDSYELYQARWAKRIFENIKEKLEHILSDYKRALKEDELLRKDIEGWKKYCAEINEGQTKMSNKNCELKFEVEKLQKENEELKFEERSRIIGKYGDVEIHDLINRILSNDYIPIQKVKDKIEEIKERKMDIVMSLVHNRDEKIEILKKDKIRIQILQELLESEE